MRYLFVFVFGILAAHCSPASENLDPKPVSLPQNRLPAATCPNLAEATWCLLFSDNASASITITHTTPKAFGFITIAELKLPIYGEVSPTDGTFTFDLWNVNPEGTLSGAIPHGEAGSTAIIAFYGATETFQTYLPQQFPAGKYFDAKQSVTGRWAAFSEATSQQTNFDIAQFGKLLLIIEYWQANEVEELALWPGERKGLGFTFPKAMLIFDGGTYMDGTFTEDLLQASASKCEDNIAGAQCEPYYWRRR